MSCKYNGLKFIIITAFHFLLQSGFVLPILKKMVRVDLLYK